MSLASFSILEMYILVVHKSAFFLNLFASSKRDFGLHSLQVNQPVYREAIQVVLLDQNSYRHNASNQACKNQQ